MFQTLEQGNERYDEPDQEDVQGNKALRTLERIARIENEAAHTGEEYESDNTRH